MRSWQLALCAALAACAVTTAPAPAYGADDPATGTATVRATPASRGADTSRGMGGAAGRALVRSGSAPGACPALLAPATGTGSAAAAAYAAKGAEASRAPHATEEESKAASSRELSSTSAVGLVLAGGAILVIAGQLLRLRLRLRRERRGDADER
ncbi:hypothetical protein ACPCUV_19805 [Streptomyces platensis]|uniref:hypothetical protein n=1 Tax=Streptomyces platensis TaxID=58346 RepID=UPI003C30BAD6